MAVVLSGFDGAISMRCRRCKADFAYPGGVPVPKDRLTCLCGKWLASGVIRSGYVQIVCPADRSLVRIAATGTTRTEAVITGPSSEELVTMIEERWQRLRFDRARRSTDLAVGIRFDVFNRDGFRCVYCGRGSDQGVMLEADHRVPRSLGGPDTLANLVTACWDCNRGKSDKILAS